MSLEDTTTAISNLQKSLDSRKSGLADSINSFGSSFNSISGSLNELIKNLNEEATRINNTIADMKTKIALLQENLKKAGEISSSNEALLNTLKSFL